VTGVSSGTFACNMLDVAEDGQIYAATLTTSSSASPFQVYQETSEFAAEALLYSGDLAGGTYRFGDTFRVRSIGSLVEVVAGLGQPPPTSTTSWPTSFLSAAASPFIPLVSKESPSRGLGTATYA